MISRIKERRLSDGSTVYDVVLIDDGNQGRVNVCCTSRDGAESFISAMQYAVNRFTCEVMVDGGES